MKPFDAKSGTYSEYAIEVSRKNPKHFFKELHSKLF